MLECRKRGRKQEIDGEQANVWNSVRHVMLAIALKVHKQQTKIGWGRTHHTSHFSPF